MQTLKSMISVRTIVVIIALLGLIWWLDQEDSPPIPAMPNISQSSCVHFDDCYSMVIALPLIGAETAYDAILRANNWQPCTTCGGVSDNCVHIAGEIYQYRDDPDTTIFVRWTSQPDNQILIEVDRGWTAVFFDCNF